MVRITGWLRRNGRLLSLLASLVFPALVSSAPLQDIYLQDFSPGLKTTDDPSLICNTCASDASNVDVEDGVVESRRGSTLQNATTLGGHTNQATRFAMEYVDTSNSFYVLSVSSNSLFYSTDGGVSNTLLTSTYGITSDSRFAGIVAYGKARLTDGTTNVILVTGTTLSVSTSQPKGLTQEFWGERVWTSTGSILRASKAEVVEDWTIDTETPDESISLPIRDRDGYSIRLIKRFKNKLLVFKDFSVDEFTLDSDGLTPIQTPLVTGLGTQHPESAVETPNEFIFLGHDGYYSYDGAVFKRISDPIAAPTDSGRFSVYNINQLNSFERSYTQTSQSDFQSGTNSNTSPNVSAGDVLLSTWTTTDTSSTNFVAGTLTDMNTSYLDGAIYLSTTNTNVENNGFESGSGTDATNWTEAGIWVRDTLVGQSGSASSSRTGITSYRFRILDYNSSALASTSYTPTTSWTQRSYSLAPYAGRNIKIQFVNPSDTTDSITSDTFLCSGQSVTHYDRIYDLGGNNIIRVDTVEGGRSTTTTGSFLSQIFDTSISSPSWLSSGSDFAANGHSITFETQVATASNGTFDSLVSWSTGSAPTSANKRFIRYKISVATATAGTALPYISSTTFSARATSGRYISPSISLGTGITSWGAFSGDKNNDGGSQTFELYTDNDTSITINSFGDVTGGFTSSQTITAGSVPTISTAAYAWVGSTHSITSASQNPSMSNFTLSWNEGDSNFPVSSIYWDGSLYSAVSISSATGNDTILRYDSNGAWTYYENLPAYYLFKYRIQPYFGSNLRGSIIRFQVDGKYEDYDGSAINPYWESKEFDWGLPTTNKVVERYSILAKYRANDVATFEWGTNRGSLTSESSLSSSANGSLDLDSISGIFYKTIKPQSKTYNRGVSHRFRISNSTTGDRFDLLGVTIKAFSEEQP